MVGRSVGRFRAGISTLYRALMPARAAGLSPRPGTSITPRLPSWRACARRPHAARYLRLRFLELITGVISLALQKLPIAFGATAHRDEAAHLNRVTLCWVS
jgi:hypothetical protein